MDFLLYCGNINKTTKVQIVDDSTNIFGDKVNCSLFLDGRARLLHSQYSNGVKDFLIIGDFIFDETKDSYENIFNNFTIERFQDLSGFFYLVIFDKIKKNLSVFNSLFSILPLYYLQTENGIFISSRVEKIAKATGRTEINRRFILENLLFNYPLFNESYINGIKLTPANSYIKIKNNKLFVERHTEIADYFPESYQKNIYVSDLADVFIQNVKKYFPKEFYYQALTGGFDGRTLTACGLYHKKNFSIYSFGIEVSSDIKIAQKLSSLANLNHNFIILDNSYVQDFSLRNGLEFIENAEGGASFSRAHYLFAAKNLSKDSNYMVTGNFGSEIFRALHVAGVVVSPNIYSLFLSKNIDNAYSKIKNAPELKWLNIDNFRQELESLLEDLYKLSCFNPQYDHLSLNKKFYVLVFEEIFRKYFGSEIKNQFYYLVNRSPFLDFFFIKQLFKSKYAGIHSEFFEHNPFKRFKGQVFYANVIKKTFPAFLNEKLDKGYYPKDILSLKGHLNIARGYFKKRFIKQIAKDSYSVYKAFSYNKKFWEELFVDQDLFNENQIKMDLKNKQNWDSIFIVLSQNYWINKVRNWK